MRLWKTRKSINIGMSLASLALFLGAGTYFYLSQPNFKADAVESLPAAPYLEKIVVNGSEQMGFLVKNGKAAEEIIIDKNTKELIITGSSVPSAVFSAEIQPANIKSSIKADSRGEFIYKIDVKKIHKKKGAHILKYHESKDDKVGEILATIVVK